MMRKIFSILFLFCATEMAAQDNYEFHVFKGMLNGKIAVEIAYQTAYNDGEWLTAGYIYYPRAKTPAPILIVGQNLKVDPKLPASENLERLRFEEFQEDGNITGRFELMYYEVEGDYHFYKGSWTNPVTGKSLPMTNMKESFELPDWYPGLPATLTAPKREAYSFKHSFEKDKDGWLQSISVDIMVNGKKSPLSFKEDLIGAFNDYQEKELPWVTEDDINFDGIPDLMVFIGLTHRAQSLYTAFVWNPAVRQFYPVDAFDEIQEPVLNAETKTITSTARDVDTLYIDVFKWKNGKLTKVSTKKEKLFD